jgi:hypothetical protein
MRSKKKKEVNFWIKKEVNTGRAPFEKLTSLGARKVDFFECL